MAIPVEFPKGSDPLDYLVSFEEAFKDHPDMRSALLGVQDSLRQALLLVGEPLGMLACITAEEEAAAFLYYGLLAKGYSLPMNEKLHNHLDKVKFVLFAEVMQKYFFGEGFQSMGGAIRVERDGLNPKTDHVFMLGEYQVVVEDFLASIIVSGDGDEAHDRAINFALDRVLKEITPKGFTTLSHLRSIAKRRNLCLYGDPDKKLRLRSEQEIAHFRNNCIAMIVLGFLVFNSKQPTISMEKIVSNIFERL